MANDDALDGGNVLSLEGLIHLLPLFSGSDERHNADKIGYERTCCSQVQCGRIYPTSRRTQSVLVSLSQSIRMDVSVLSRHVIDCNLFARQDSTLTLIHSRLDVRQKSRGWMICCGLSRSKMELSLAIRRLGFTKLFEDLIRDQSPALKIRGDVLLPPSPLLTDRSLTAPSSTPLRMFKHSARAREAQAELVAISRDNTPHQSRRTTPIAVQRRLDRPAEHKEVV